MSCAMIGAGNLGTPVMTAAAGHGPSPNDAGVSGITPVTHWPRAAASAAIFRRVDGRFQILLVERGKGAARGLWSLPGGHVEPGEPARAAAIREVREETGGGVDLRGLADVVDVISRAPDGQLRAHYILSVYFGTWSGGEPVAQSDAADARFVDLDRLADLRLTDGAAPVIERAAQLLIAQGSLA